jgi:hypothetical protein
MKTIKNTVMTLSIAFMAALSANAKTWIVAPTTIAGNYFTNIQAAHDAASAGDTINVIPNSTSYGNLVCNKTLVINGGGYLLFENNMNLPYSSTGTLIGNVTFTGTSTGSIIQGFNFNGVGGIGNYNLFVFVNNIVVRRNSNVRISIAASITNLFVSQNYKVAIGCGSFNITNLFVNNNLFDAGNFASCTNTCIYLWGIDATGNISGKIINNYFNGILPVGNGNLFSGPIQIGNFQYSNNIFNYGYMSQLSSSGNTFYNNIGNFNSSNSTFWNGYSGNGNMTISGLSNYFVGGNSPEGKYMLNSTVVGKNAGTDGTDIGMFGGSTPYVLSGIPNIPYIYNLSVPTNSNGNTLNFTLSTKSNP